MTPFRRVGFGVSMDAFSPAPKAVSGTDTKTAEVAATRIPRNPSIDRIIEEFRLIGADDTYRTPSPKGATSPTKES